MRDFVRRRNFFGDFGDFLGLGFRAGGDLRARSLVLRQNAPLHPLAGLTVQGVGDVLELPVLLALGRHGNEDAVGTLNHLQIRNEKTVVEDDRDVGFQPLFLHGEDLYLGDLHWEPPEDSVRRRYSSRVRVRLRNTRASGCRSARRSSASAAAPTRTIADPEPVMADSEATDRAESSRIFISTLVSSTANARSFGPKNFRDESTSRNPGSRGRSTEELEASRRWVA